MIKTTPGTTPGELEDIMYTKLYLFKCMDNRSGCGAVPVYFDNAAAAIEYGKYDYVSYCGLVNMPKNSDYPVQVCHAVEDVDKCNFVHAWGIVDNGELWIYNKKCPV